MSINAELLSELHAERQKLDMAADAMALRARSLEKSNEKLMAEKAPLIAVVEAVQSAHAAFIAAQSVDKSHCLCVHCSSGASAGVPAHGNASSRRSPRSTVVPLRGHSIIT